MPQGFQLEEDRYGSPGQQAIAGVEGLAKGVAGPLATLAETKLLHVKPEDIKGREEANPWTHGLSEVGGFAGSMLTGVGEGALVAHAGEAAAKAAGFAAKGAEGAGILSAAGRGATSAATEMALLSSGDEMSKHILDPDLSLGSSAVNVGLNGILGALGGGALGAVGPVWRKTVGDKAGQFIEDFRGRFKERVENPNPVEALHKELSDLHSAISSTADEVYGPRGLKAQEIAAVMPEMNEKITQQVRDLTTRMNGELAEMRAKPDLYPERLVSKFENDLRRFEGGVFETAPAQTSFEPGGEKYAVTQGNVTELMDEVPKKYSQKLKHNVTIEKVPVLADETPKLGQPTWAQDADKTVSLPQGGNVKSAGDIFNAIQDLKQQMQSYAKFDKFVKPVDEAYDFVSKAKNLSHDLRTSLENKDAWGKAAERQSAINKAFTDYLPSLKDFEKKFMTELGGEKVVDPGKVNTYVNQLGKPNAEIKQQVLDNFVKATDKYQSVLRDTHKTLGLENPFPEMSMQSILGSLKKLPAGARVADKIIDKGLANLAGQGIGAGIGGAVGHMMGGAGIGALVGEHALGPFFSSVLPALAKPLVENPTFAHGFSGAVDFGTSVIRGEKLMGQAVGNVFKAGSEIVPATSMPTKKDREKLEKSMKDFADNSSDMLNHGANFGHYLPEHATNMALNATAAVQYLNGLKPLEVKNAPLDTPFENPFQRSRYNDALDIAQQPLVVLQKMKDGTITDQDVADLQNIHPAAYRGMVQKVTHEIIEKVADGKSIPYGLQVGITRLTGVPMDSTITGPAIASIQMAQNRTIGREQQQDVANSAQAKSLDKMASAYATPGQSREQKNQMAKS
jgi:hypothetical protein